MELAVLVNGMLCENLVQFLAWWLVATVSLIITNLHAELTNIDPTPRQTVLRYRVIS